MTDEPRSEELSEVGADPGVAGFRSVGVVAKLGSREAIQTAHEVAEWLRRRGIEVSLDEVALRSRTPAGVTAFDPQQPYDLVVVLGGDGTLLSVARSLREGVPIFGVNLGRLGFLTEAGRSELYPSLLQVLGRRYRIEERSLFDVELVRASGGRNRFEALNDAVIAKGALARIIELTLQVDGHMVARYRSDGLIISTPTGSTAYNLSAGGPILYPLLEVAVITPICPHTLSLRPVVVPDRGQIEVVLETPKEEVYLTLDGQEGTTLSHRDAVRITRSSRRVRLVKTTDRSFYDSLRGKLRWGGLSGDGAEKVPAASPSAPRVTGPAEPSEEVPPQAGTAAGPETEGEKRAGDEPPRSEQPCNDLPPDPNGKPRS